jgi:hypothetical protein
MSLRELHWSLYFLFWAAAIVAAGTLLGAVVFPFAGLLFPTGHGFWQLVETGAGTGAFYFFIWAPGTAIVLCVRRAYRRRHPGVE